MIVDIHFGAAIMMAMIYYVCLLNHYDNEYEN